MMKFDLAKFMKRQNKRLREHEASLEDEYKKRSEDFSITRHELKALDEWRARHSLVCPLRPSEENPFGLTGAIGGGMTYSFTPTGLGMITKVSCACGEKEELTDFVGW